MDDDKPEIVRIPLRQSIQDSRDRLVEKQHEALTMMRKRTKMRMPYPPESGLFKVCDWAASRALRQSD